jgi:RNA polymerase sigma-32 factor
MSTAALSNYAPATNFNLPAISAGSIESYIRSVNLIPMLSEADEQRYAHELRTSSSLGAAGSLVTSHLRLVVSVARGYLGYGLPHADLIQEGNVGLMKAVKRFDPDKGVRLASFAVHWIKAEIHEYILKNWRLMKVATTKAQRKLFFNLRSMVSGMNAEDSSNGGAGVTLGSLGAAQRKKIAKQLNVKEHEVAEMESRLAGRDVSMDGTVDGDDDSTSYAPVAYLADEAMGPAEHYDYVQSETKGGAGLAAALESLDARSRRIIQARWLNEGEEMTLHELADEFGVSAERIRQIEVQAMKKMKGIIGEH